MPDLVSRLHPIRRMDLCHSRNGKAVLRSRGSWGSSSQFPGEAPYRGPSLSFRLGWTFRWPRQPTRDQKFPAKASGESCRFSWQRANLRHFWAIRRRATRTWGSTVLPATSRLSAAAARKSSDTLIGSPSPLRRPFFPTILPPLPSPRKATLPGVRPGAFCLSASAPFRQLAIRD